jgi:hypothetical protein
MTTQLSESLNRNRKEMAEEVVNSAKEYVKFWTEVDPGVIMDDEQIRLGWGDEDISLGDLELEETLREVWNSAVREEAERVGMRTSE